jgi:hypothetical protein
VKKPTVYEFIPKLGQLRYDVLFGDVWEHPTSASVTGA